MNNKILENACVYYDDRLNQKRINKLKRQNRKIQKESPQLRKIKSEKIGNLNRQYFPGSGPAAEDSGTESNATTKIRKNSYSGMKGVRPKPNSKSKSVSISEHSTKKELCDQISKLTSQLENKNKALIKVSSPERIRQAQLKQLYRVISFYEGKIKQLEQQVKRYEEVLEKIGRQCDQKSRHKSQVQQIVKLFQGMRKENIELSGKLEQKDHTIIVLEQKAHKLQIKMNFMTSKQSYLKRTASKIESSSIQKSKLLPSLSISKNHLSSAIRLKEKQENYGNLHSKMNKIELSLNNLRKENQMLSKEIQEKDKKLFQLEKKLVQSSLQQPTFQKPTTSYLKQDPLNKLTLLESPPTTTINIIHSPVICSPPPQPQPQPQLSSLREPTCTSSVLAMDWSQGQHMLIFRKLRYQMLTEEQTFEELVQVCAILLQFLTSEQLQPQLLQQSPYNLTTQQAEHLTHWLHKLSQQCHTKKLSPQQTLAQIIPRYTNISLRRENNLKIQISNQFMNREEQWRQLMERGDKEKEREKMGYEEMEGLLKGWGLEQDHVDVLGKFCYQETGQVGGFYFAILGGIMRKWANK